MRQNFDGLCCLLQSHARSLWTLKFNLSLSLQQRASARGQTPPATADSNRELARQAAEHMKRRLAQQGLHQLAGEPRCPIEQVQGARHVQSWHVKQRLQQPGCTS